MDDPVIVTMLALLIFFLLVICRVPIALALIGSATVGIAVLRGNDVALAQLMNTPFTTMSSYALIVVPMFILLGALIANASIGDKIFYAVNLLTRRLPGGLGAATVLATGLFSGISGSSAADVATLGRVAAREMSLRGYTREYATAIVAAAGTFAVLIPPSIAPVIYGTIAEQSIGRMLLAAVVPGILSCLILALYIIARAMLQSRRQVAAPTPAMEAAADTLDGGSGAGGGEADVPAAVLVRDGPTTEVESNRASWFTGLACAVVLFAIIVVGVFTGVFTATESSAVGAFVAFVLAALITRRRLPRMVMTSLREATHITSMIFLILIGGSMLSTLVALSGLAQRAAAWATSLDAPGLVIIAAFLLIALVLGFFLDGLTTMLIMAPLTLPIVEGLGYDLVWFGILLIKVIEIGLITPPVGINVFVACGAVGGVKSERVFALLVPFVLLDIAITVLFLFVPEIVMWLPNRAD